MPKEIFHDPLLSFGNVERAINTGVFWSLHRCSGTFFRPRCQRARVVGQEGGGPDTAAAAESASNS